MSAPEKDPCVYFAAERTFLAWIRTGIALMGFGFVVARFGLFLRGLEFTQKVTQFHNLRFSVGIGTALVLTGVVVDIAATFHHLRVIRDLKRGEGAYDRPSPLAISVSVILALVGLAMAAYLTSA